MRRGARSRAGQGTVPSAWDEATVGRIVAAAAVVVDRRCRVGRGLGVRQAKRRLGRRAATCAQRDASGALQVVAGCGQDARRAALCGARRQRGAGHRRLGPEEQLRRRHRRPPPRDHRAHGARRQPVRLRRHRRARRRRPAPPLRRMLRPTSSRSSIGANDIAAFDPAAFEAGHPRGLRRAARPTRSWPTFPASTCPGTRSKVAVGNRILREDAAERGLTVVPLHDTMKRQGLGISPSSPKTSSTRTTTATGCGRRRSCPRSRRGCVDAVPRRPPTARSTRPMAPQRLSLVRRARGARARAPTRARPPGAPAGTISTRASGALCWYQVAWALPAIASAWPFTISVFACDIGRARIPTAARCSSGCPPRPRAVPCRYASFSIRPSRSRAPGSASACSVDLGSPRAGRGARRPSDAADAPRRPAARASP